MADSRIAIINETGKQYFINKLDFQRRIAHVFGEVEKYKGAKTYHAKGFTISLDEVTVKKVKKTEELCSELFQQGLDADIESGEFELKAIHGKRNKTYVLKKI